MRVTSLELSGFRGFAQTKRFDLDADAVIVVGANGQGKTSLFDGILWAVTGTIPRLSSEDQNLVSMFSESGEARASLELRNAVGQPCRLMRSFDGTQQHFRLEIDGTVLREDAARLRLLEVLWPEALITSDGAAALTAAFTRSVYLQQDLVREFIEADSEQDRFNAVSELVGAGRATELQHQLERAKQAWTRATNLRAQELESTRQQLARLEPQFADLGSATEAVTATVEPDWLRWWDGAQKLGAQGTQVPAADSLEASSALDAAVKQLETLRRTSHRLHDLSRELLLDIRARSESILPVEASLRRELEGRQRDVESARQALADAETRAAHDRRAQVELREARAELQSLAQLALRHLGDRCPVCAQRYDEAMTKTRLEEIIGTTDDDAVSPVVDEVAALAATLEERELAFSQAEDNLRRAQQVIREHRAWLNERDRRLRELDVDPQESSAVIEELERLTNELDANIATLDEHQKQGERLALTLIRAKEGARRTEVEHKILAVRAEFEQLNELVRSREQTGDLAGQIIDGFREAASDVVKEQLDRIEPLLQRIYARVDPHPAFRGVRFHSRVIYRRGRVTTAIDDPVAGLATDTPEIVLSSSQLNVLAVSVFLALNLGVPTLPLHTAMLDDPLESLDSTNLLGVIDLLRRIKDRRQLIISTHDEQFGSLLARKLRPAEQGKRTIVIEFDGWTREGPVAYQHDVARDSRPLRIAV